MKNTLLIMITIMAISTLIITGCGKKNESDKGQNGTPPSTNEQDQNESNKESNAQSKGKLFEYNLGESTLSTSGGKSVKYEVQGVLGVPEKQNAPILVVIHGSHPIEKASEDRYDNGFNYLLQSLSDQGNLVISMNVGINYSFESGEPIGNERTRQIIDHQLGLLKKAIDGDEKVFGRDLKGIGDLNNVMLMGHSRGGLDVIEYAAKPLTGINITGIISVAPSTYKEFETELPNVSMGIIIPSMDGDVSSLDGNDIYEDIVKDRKYTKTAELIYLKNANHGYFNTKLTKPDLSHNEEDVRKLMPAEQQRNFLVQYVSDFIKSNTVKGKPVFVDKNQLESKAYGCDVLLRTYSGTSELIYSSESQAKILSQNANVSREIFSFIPKNNTVDMFKMPGGSAFEAYALQHITWDKEKAKVSIPINKDISKYKFLDIDMAVDSTDLKNKNGQSMKITLTRGKGQNKEILIPSESAALLWQQGEILEVKGWDDDITHEYSVYTPLVTLRLDLSSIKDFKLGELDNITLSWEDSKAGSIMLRTIRGVS